VNQYSSNITNLQLVIQQIQKENERLVLAAESKRYEEGSAAKAREAALLRQRQWQESRFQDTTRALGAAGRLTEQLDLKENLVSGLRRECAIRDDEIKRLGLEIVELKNSQAGKVDKQLMKSMVLGYFSTPADKKHEVERLLARILDFSQDEMAKANLQVGGRRQSQSNQKQESLSQQFVQFLETESKRERNGAMAAVTSPSMRELAKDFAKAAIASQDKEVKSNANPFLTSASPVTSSAGSLSAASSTSSMNNHLLYQADNKPSPVQPFILNNSKENNVFQNK
jgi:hypothetical protein